MTNNTQEVEETIETENLAVETVTVGLSPENRQQISETVGKLVAAREFVVDSNEAFSVAADELKSIKAKAKELDETRKAITKPLDESKKRVMDLFRKPLEYLTQAEGILKRSMIGWQTEQENIRKKEEARLQELARKEEERLRKRAEAAEAKGQTEKAEMLEQQADAVPAPVVTTARPQAAGISYRTTWSAEVTDANALLKGVLDGTVPRAALKIDMQFLNRQAVALKKELNYPGVSVKSKRDIAARS